MSNQLDVMKLADELEKDYFDDVRVLMAADELRRLYSDCEDMQNTIIAQGEILRGVVEAVRGKPPEFVSWSHHDAVAVVTDELHRLHAENEALRADAERYRWLRKRIEFLFDDATIDAARSKE